MRLPLATELKTRPGDNTKDARLKNSYAEVRGDQTVVRKRSGATDQGLTSGAGMAQILTCWEGLLAVTGDALYLFFDDLEYTIDWSSATEWDSGTTYTSGDWVWYNGQLWRWVSGTTGVPPSTGAWSNVQMLSYDEDETYDIGDEVRVDGVTYYCYSTGTTGIPVSNTDFWSTSPPPATRYRASITFGVSELGPIGATKVVAAVTGYELVPHKTCATRNGSNVWMEYIGILEGYGDHINSTQYYSVDCITIVNQGQSSVGTVISA